MSDQGTVRRETPDGPVAQVRVTLKSLAEGDAEVEVAIDPNGPLRGAYGSEEERFAALQTLFETLQRELADALDSLVEGDEPETPSL